MLSLRFFLLLKNHFLDSRIFSLYPSVKEGKMKLAPNIVLIDPLFCTNVKTTEESGDCSIKNRSFFLLIFLFFFLSIIAPHP